MSRQSLSREELLHLIEIRQIFHLAFTSNDLFYNSSESLLSKHGPRGGTVMLNFILYRKMENYQTDAESRKRAKFTENWYGFSLKYKIRIKHFLPSHKTTRSVSIYRLLWMPKIGHLSNKFNVEQVFVSYQLNILPALRAPQWRLD